MNKAPILLLGIMVLTGCAAATGTLPYGLKYREALAGTPGTPQDADTVAKRFLAAYSDLRAPDLQERIEGLYAKDIYFNDTMTTLRSRDALIEYLKSTANRVQVMKVEMLGSSSSGNDVYLRWFMHLEFRAGWRRAATDTVGISHLRLDENGRIVLHQDFWDKAEGIFREVPFVGALITPEGL
jgi:hypothetical protein